MRGRAVNVQTWQQHFFLKRHHSASQYFAKPGVRWEYATVAGESARAFVYFTGAGMRA